MKTRDQVIRHISHCRFSDEDWSKVLEYCRLQYGGGMAHRALRWISDSTYEEFCEWLDSGWGSGDIVRYGHTVGIVGDSTPDRTYLSAYLDYEGNLIVKELDVFSACKLLPLPGEERSAFVEVMTDHGLEFSSRLGVLTDMYKPKVNDYVVASNVFRGEDGVGVYSSFEDGCHNFSIMCAGGRIFMGLTVEQGQCTIRPATAREVQTLHRTATDRGYVFNERTCEFTRRRVRGKSNIYWYISDRWTVLADRDNKKGKHNDRFLVGNYFVDQTEALCFLQRLIKMKKGDD